MQLEVIGVGGAGCRIAAAILEVDPADHSFVADVFAFDTDSACLDEVTSIPDPYRHRYGETIESGLNGNLQRGRSVGNEYVEELSRRLDRGRPAVADAFLVAVGLGGATGGGTIPQLVENLQTLYDAPVYVLATLPAERELAPPSDGGSDAGNEPTARPMAEENATRTLEELDGTADAVLCFDNERWLKTAETMADARDRLNRELATRVATFFSATADATEEGEVTAAETIIDANDVGRIFGNETGIATIGYGKQRIETDSGGSRFGLGLFSAEPSVETSEAVSAIETTIGKALRDRLTLECEPENAARAMLVVGGPPAWLNRRAIADGRRTIEEATGSVEILGGDAPRPESDVVFAVVVLAGVDPVERLEAIRSRTTPLDRDRTGR
ncbi:cell division protein FtsZ [Natrarchaeobius halalkaliphilus]|uniref:Tubulin-like protein CetZ n=1 Tax=Natrarchaeobius halalkaliphilus TaxID=1679091 RepID=A0A3N6LT17_9EURY|nr:tubulin/FtsZ family protein [Natrarchaeobius halalkaliphilus]RQG93143.1 cell division protein FtsZ [Natrarchaeobius halalkaliphilus]